MELWEKIGLHFFMWLQIIFDWFLYGIGIAMAFKVFFNR